MPDQNTNSVPHPLTGQEILFTRQRHEAKRMGLHWDYRLVLGDKAYSWATKKEMPQPGSAIILFEQPVHDREYALSPVVEIPDGNYGAGITRLDFVRKAKVDEETEDGKLVINSGLERFLLKKLDPVKYGEKAWLFKNLSLPSQFTRQKVTEVSLEKNAQEWLSWDQLQRKKGKIPEKYREGWNSTFDHDGDEYFVDQAIQEGENSPVIEHPVKDLTWVMKYDTVKPDRMKYADVKQPVLVTNWNNKKVVIDGLHRLAKAKELGLKTIPTRYVDMSLLTPFRKQIDYEEDIPKSAAEDLTVKFKPDLTPDQMEALGVLKHKGSQYEEGTGKDNFFGVSASQPTWPDKWHNEQHPQGWYQWYQGYVSGKRTDDDERQMKRWISFKARHLAQLQKADPTLQDLSVQPKRRQALLNWSIAPGVDVNKYITKIAKTVEKQNKGEELKPHHVSALRKLDRTGGIILNHSLGSGKTSLMLRAIQQAQKEDKNKDSLVIAPASLVSNFDKEIAKLKIKLDRKRIQIYSYEKALNIEDQLARQRFGVVALDEAHKIRNPEAKRTKALMGIAQRADKRILATGTSVYNSPQDVSSLINVAAGYDALPTDKAKFSNKFLAKINKPQKLSDRILGREPEQEEVLKNRKELAELFKDHVSFYDSKNDPDAKEHFPEVEEETIPVEMSKKQLQYYALAENKIPFMLRMKLRWNMPMDAKDKALFNAFSVQTRQVSNGHRHLVEDKDSVELSPKIKEAVKNLEAHKKGDKNFRGVVYSNFIPAGLEEYSRALKEKNIPHNLYTGELSAAEKDKVQKDYNEGKTPVLLISSAGSEGLNLHGTKVIQHLDGHWNNSKSKQITGRAIRFKSHSHLPKEERKVKVEHYRSVHPKGLWGKAPTSIDEYLDNTSQDKSKVFEQMEQLMKENN